MRSPPCRRALLSCNARITVAALTSMAYALQSVRALYAIAVYLPSSNAALLFRTACQSSLPSDCAHAMGSFALFEWLHGGHSSWMFVSRFAPPKASGTMWSK